MTHFIAIKINYDHREFISPHLKYSVLPTSEQYKEYIKRYNAQGKGGNGFHECLNFSIPEIEPVKLYLPPTCIPAKKYKDDDFVIFSFTYQNEEMLSSYIIGVHAGVHILSTDPGGITREDQRIQGIDPLHYHAVAPNELVTLFVPPLKYDKNEDRYMPILKKWGYGNRNLNSSNESEELSFRRAKNIITDALNAANVALRNSLNMSEKVIIRRQIGVLHRINTIYELNVEVENIAHEINRHTFVLPNREIGYLGEKYIYEEELRYIRSIDEDLSKVEWTSQAEPTSPFDIKTIRKSIDGSIYDHFIEVKSSTSEDVNVYISDRQIDFFKCNENCSSFKFVKFLNNQQPEVEEMTLKDLTDRFELIPIKFKLRNL